MDDPQTNAIDRDLGFISQRDRMHSGMGIFLIKTSFSLKIDDLQLYLNIKLQDPIEFHMFVNQTRVL